jgi:hypothetical protein
MAVKKPKACWKGYTAVGMKNKNGRKVPNCVPVSEEECPVRRQYKELKKLPLGELRNQIKQSHRVIDVSGFDKESAISHILRSQHGHKRVNQAFGLDEETEARNATPAEYEKSLKDLMKRPDVLSKMREEVKQMDEKGDFWHPNPELDSKLGGRGGAGVQNKTPVKTPDKNKDNDHHLALLKRLAAAGKRIAAEEVEQMDEATVSALDAIRQFASRAHEDWRKTLPAEERNKPRMRSKNGGPVADINVPFHKLHPSAQKENLDAAKAALRAVTNHGRDTESAAEHVHNEWMKRNPKSDYNAHQHVPYRELPEDEKQKDRDHVITMRSILSSKRKTKLDEKHLTPAERKKREEIAQAMERKNPGMDMGKKMAIATAQAKKVTEGYGPERYGSREHDWGDGPEPNSDKKFPYSGQNKSSWAHVHVNGEKVKEFHGPTSYDDASEHAHELAYQHKKAGQKHKIEIRDHSQPNTMIRVNETRNIIREVIKKKVDDQGTNQAKGKTATGEPLPKVQIDPVIDLGPTRG